MPIKTDIRAWNQTFERYLSLRNSSREVVTVQKARDFAFKVFKNLKPVNTEKIKRELTTNKLILKLTVYRLLHRDGPDVLKGKASSRRRRAVHSLGITKKALTPGNKKVRDYAKHLMASRIRSAGYHRVAFLLLAQKLGAPGASAQINPRSRLNKTTFQKTHNALRTIVRTEAVARGLNCASTNTAVDTALAQIKADMEKEIAKRLAQARKEAGFSR